VVNDVLNVALYSFLLHVFLFLKDLKAIKPILYIFKLYVFRIHNSPVLELISTLNPCILHVLPPKPGYKLSIN